MQTIEKSGTAAFNLRSATRSGASIEYRLALLSVLLGFALRWWSAAMRSDLWYDEVYSYRTASLPFGQMLHSLLLGGDTNPPLYTLLLHFWLKLGNSDTHIKMLSLLFALASIGLMYALGRMIGDVKVAFTASLLLTVSGSAIRYSVEARPYALFLFLSLLSTVLFLKAIKKNLSASHWRSNLGGWAWYAVVTTLAIYTHWFSLLLIPLHTLGLIIYARCSKLAIVQYALSLLLILCCCLPLFPFLINQVTLQNTVGGFCWPSAPSLHSLIDLASFLAGDRNLLVMTMVILLITIFTRIRTSSSRGGVSKSHLLFFCGYVIAPIVLVATVSFSLAHYSFFVPRYFFPFIAGVHIVVAMALSRMNRKLTIIFVALFVLSPVVKAIKHWPKPERPYSSLAGELRCKPEYLILHLTPMSYYPALYYSHEPAPKQKVVWSEAIGLGYVLDYNLKGAALNADDLFQADAGLQTQREFYIVRDSLDVDPRMSQLENQFRSDTNYLLVSEEKIGNLTLELYRVNTYAGKSSKL